MNNKKYIKISFITIISLVLFLFTGSISIKADDPYVLKEVVVLSRHNIRAPLSTKGSVLDSATPHDWYEWSSAASELSLRGGMLETAMGQYFRKWLVNEELLPENYRPTADEIRFYANGKQRTIATAQYFSSGFLPVANSDLEINIEYDKMDPVFNPVLTFVSEQYNADAIAQMKKLAIDLTDEYQLLMNVLDFKESDAYKNGELTEFVAGDDEFSLEIEKEPAVKGSLRNATSLADALVLQLYEEDDLKEAAFGHDISMDDWKAISKIKDTFVDTLYTAEDVSVNLAHPLLKEIRNELNNKNRIFTFLCGHDSNLASVLGALNVEEYELPEAIETKTPIGSKLVFEKWQKDNEEFIKVEMIYNSVDQLRNLSILDLNNGPMRYTLSFKGLEADEQGMYKLNDFIKHLENRINRYDELLDHYDLRLPKTGIE